jgi:tRNA (guanine37-N1)-methyltransferase
MYKKSNRMRRFQLFYRTFVHNSPNMRIDIITVLPELLASPFGHSIVQRAQKKGFAEIFVHNLRSFGKGNHRMVDDYCFGGDAGMILMVEPIYHLITSLLQERDYDEVIYLTPDGTLFDQPMANRLSCLQNIILLCGHYKGIDHRIREHLITKEVSIGDYVLSGGELAAAVVTDAVVRLIPGVLSDETSALSDSFQDGLLAPPVYSRPAEFNGWKVPDVLLSGNPKLIRAWQEEQVYERTKTLRPELLNDIH